MKTTKEQNSRQRKVRFPIRLKIMISLLTGITAVVSVITFTMATYFHDDKRAYIHRHAESVGLSVTPAPTH